MSVESISKSQKNALENLGGIGGVLCDTLSGKQCPTNAKSMKNQIDRLSYSIFEVAKTLGVSSRTVHSLIKRGEIPHFRVGQRVLIPADGLREFIALRTKTEKS